MTPPELRTRAIRQLVVTSVVVLALTIVGLVIVFTTSILNPVFFVGFGILMILVLTSALWVSLITYASFALTNGERLAALSVSHPEATLVHAVMTAPVTRQLRELATQLGMLRPKIRVGTYATIASGSDEVTFYGGAAKPQALLTLPRESLTSAALATTKAARQQLPSIALTFAGAHDPVTIVPVYWPGIAPKPVPESVLVEQIAAINAAR